MEINFLKEEKEKTEQEIKNKIQNLKDQLKMKEEEFQDLTSADTKQDKLVAKVELLEEKVAYIKQQIIIQVRHFYLTLCFYIDLHFAKLSLSLNIEYCISSLKFVLFS